MNDPSEPRGKLERISAFALQRGGLLALVTAVLYIWLAPHHVVDGDNSEFSTLSMTGGVAHPSGYPLYVLYLRAMSWLPGASPAHTAAIATCLLGALTVLVLHAACRAWGARPLAATLATALYATGPVVLRVVTEAEVFGLNDLVVATVLWLSAERGPLRGTRRAAVLGLVAGLGLSNHLTCVLIAPVGILGVVRGAREHAATSGHRALAAAGLAVVGLAVGLSTYGYLLVAPDSPMSWGVVRDVSRLAEIIMREDYGGPTAFRVGGPEVSAWTNVAALARSIGRAWLYAPAIAGLAALVWALRKPAAASGESRTGWLLLGLSFLVAGPLLVIRFNVPPEGLGLYVNQRFHLLPLLLLAPAVARAADAISIPRPELAIALLATVGVIGLSALSLPYVGRVHSPAVQSSATNMLDSLPEGAVVIHSQDELHAVTGYVQTALGVRRDVRVVTWTLMTLPWYRDRVARQGITSAPGSGSPQVRLVRALLARGTPVFVDRLQSEVATAFSTHPYGILIRVVPPGESPPSPQQVFELNEKLYARFAVDYPLPGPDDEFATEVHRRYRDTWTMIGTVLQRRGQQELAARAFGHATRLGPQ
jgi:hypothetical protein